MLLIENHKKKKKKENVEQYVQSEESALAHPKCTCQKRQVVQWAPNSVRAQLGIWTCADRSSSKELSVEEPDRECAQPPFRVQPLCAGTGAWKQKRGLANNSFYQQVTSSQLIYSPPLLSQVHTNGKTRTTPSQLLQLTCIPLPLSRVVTTSTRVCPKGRSRYSIIPQTYKED